MNAQQFVKVTSANGTLQAISLQSALESAGIPAAIVAPREGAYLDVLVPSGSLCEARALLYPERRSGEIFYVVQK